MIGKTDWTQYLHAIRKREIDMVFSLLPEMRFTSGLEVGAGDGFQTTLIAQRADRLISSDLNFKRIKESLKVPGVVYKIIDADSIGGVFKNGTFDLIFSSNVLEHLRDPQTFLTQTLPMLTDNGYAVHIVPSRHIKIFYLVLYYPHLVLLAMDRIIGKLKGDSFFKGSGVDLENNINSVNTRNNSNVRTHYPNRLTGILGRLKKFLFPSPHGNFPGHIQEFIAFGRTQWECLFTKAGYSVAAYATGPAFSGYGFGFLFLRRFLEHCGVSSEHIFILKKMSAFESVARSYTNSFLRRGSAYEKEKFVQDWLKKEGNAKAFLADFKKDVGDPKDKKVLDVGFGNGIMLLEFARAGAEVYGLETENSLLNLALDRFSGNNVKAALMTYDGKSFPFADNFFHYAYSTSVLEHMSYPEAVISEIFRTLVPGGRFYLSFPNKYAPKESHTGLWFISWLPRPLTQLILKWSGSSPLEDWNLRFVSFFALKKMARKAGFRIIYTTKSSSSVRRFVKKGLAYLGIHYGALLKTIIIVLEKPANKLQSGNEIR